MNFHHPFSGTAAGDYNIQKVIVSLGPVPYGFGLESAWHRSCLHAAIDYDVPSLAAGASDTVQTVTVPGAALGDPVIARFSVDAGPSAGGAVQIIAWVSAANTVKFFAQNPSSVTQDPASGRVLISVSRNQI